MTEPKPIYNEKFDIVTDLENIYHLIRDEYFNIISEECHIRWHEKFLYTGDWNVFGLVSNYKNIGSTYKYCKNTAKLLKKHKRLVSNAGFSILKPNTQIHPHVGYSSDVLRCHLGIDIPAGDCCLNVGGHKVNWENGKAFVFDDTFIHSAWNNTEKARVVMLLDLNKDLLQNSTYQ